MEDLLVDCRVGAKELTIGRAVSCAAYLASDLFTQTLDLIPFDAHVLQRNGCDPTEQPNYTMSFGPDSEVAETGQSIISFFPREQTLSPRDGPCDGRGA